MSSALDRPATTHWALTGLMAQMYPKVRVQPGLLFIDDGDVLTAGGGAAGMDLGRPASVPSAG